MNKKAVSIKDIALKAKLTPASVSRALNKDPRHSQATIDRVRKIARQMGYTPNLKARGLVKNKSFLIGLVMYDFRNPFYAELTRSIQETAEALGYWVIPSSTDDDPEKARMRVESMMNIGVEGIIFASCTLEDPLVEDLLNREFPVVQVNRKLKKKKGNQITLNNQYGAYLAVNHLKHMGYKRIGMIGGPDNLSTSNDRYRGYVQALHEMGIEEEEEIIKRGPFFSQDTGYSNTMRLMHLVDPPRAIFCADDYIAMGAMRALGEMGLNIPEDTAVVGFDNADLSSHPLIQLTTVNQDTREMGRLAATTIIDHINNNNISDTSITLEPQLVIRHTCGYKR